MMWTRHGPSQAHPDPEALRTTLLRPGRIPTLAYVTELRVPLQSFTQLDPPVTLADLRVPKPQIMAVCDAAAATVPA